MKRVSHSGDWCAPQAACSAVHGPFFFAFLAVFGPVLRAFAGPVEPVVIQRLKVQIKISKSTAWNFTTKQVILLTTSGQLKIATRDFSKTARCNTCF